jgi:hypothetical protein
MSVPIIRIMPVEPAQQPLPPILSTQKSDPTLYPDGASIACRAMAEVMGCDALTQGVEEKGREGPWRWWEADNDQLRIL